MLYYVSLNVRDLASSGSFYDSILAPLGWRRHDESATAIGWGLTRAEFFISSEQSERPGFGSVSFPARSIPAVKASYQSGMENGGESVVEPGAAPLHGSRSYAARLRDPDGYLVEIVSAPE